MEGRRYGCEHWVQRIDEQNISGLSVVELCLRHEVLDSCFYPCRRKLAEGFASESPFVLLRVIASWELGVELLCEATIRISWADETTLRCVLSVRQ